MNHRPVHPTTRRFARSLRAGQTDAERKLWLILRSRRLADLKWRRQVPIGPYIVDFVCLQARIVVECDGSQHAGSLRDEKRDAWLEREGFVVLRFWNHEILQTPGVVTDTIRARAGLPV